MDEAFPAKFAAAKLGGAEDGPVILLDADGSEAPAAAAALASTGASGERKLFFVADGSEGPKGWKASGEGWKAPSKGLSLNLGGLKNVGASLEALASDFEAAPTGAKAGLAAGALAAAGILLFNEVEAVLELAGALAAGQFILKRLVFAADRKATAAELDALVREVAPADLGRDLAAVAAKVVEDPGPRAASSAKASSSSAAPAPQAAAPAASSAPAAAAAEPAAAGSLGSRAPSAGDAEAAAAAGAAGAPEAREWIAAWRDSKQ